MKKSVFLCVLAVMLMLLSCGVSLAVVKEISAIDNGYMSEEILKKVMFDYNFLTKNSETETYRIFYSLTEKSMNIEESEYIKSLNIEESNLERKIIYIQSNYKEMTEAMNEKQKLMLDRYLLENTLKYYYDILGRDYKYEEKGNMEANNDVSPYNTSSEKVVTIKVCADPSPNGASGGEGLDPLMGHHGWIQIHNLTTRTLKVGGLDVPSLCEISIGTWPLSTTHSRNMV